MNTNRKSTAEARRISLSRRHFLRGLGTCLALARFRVREAI